jgi:hypothetical protein
MREFGAATHFRLMLLSEQSRAPAPAGSLFWTSRATSRQSTMLATVRDGEVPKVSVALRPAARLATDP